MDALINHTSSTFDEDTIPVFLELYCFHGDFQTQLDASEVAVVCGFDSVDLCKLHDQKSAVLSSKTCDEKPEGRKY